MPKTREHFFSLAILFIIYIYIYICNLSMPLFADDYTYLFIFNSQDRIKSFWDVIESQWVHYFTWGGRTVAHILVQIFLLMGKEVFNFLNAAAFTFLLLLIYWVARGEKPSLALKPLPLILIFLCIWSCTRSFGETVFWLTGSGNYLWTTCLILLFILPYSIFYHHSQTFSNINFLFAFLFGILAGWTNENTAIVTIILITAANTYFYKKGRLQKWMIAAWLGLLIGFVFMAMAPGNYIRKEIFLQHEKYSFLKNVEGTFKNTFRCLLWQSPLWLMLVHSYKKYDLHKKSIYLWSPQIIFILAFALISVMTNLVMIVSPTFPARASFASPVFLTIAFIASCNYINIQKIIIPNYIKAVSFGVLCIITLITMPWTLNEYLLLKKENRQRIYFIEQEKEKGHLDLLIPSFTVPSGAALDHVFVFDISKTKVMDYRNYHMAKYYKVNSVLLK